ncbi:peroxiredoxin [uncultured Agrococcus sp.]|uniref:peroxiredoxin n=1 Tax=uncultured Agrococcus sp. TaxID=382258 RepID=UPI0025D40822|nr:peroxiredoxin [uncultured Agrococcus sp.]
MAELDKIAPDFTLTSHRGEHVALSDFRGKSAVALVFYPAAFTGRCTGELCELRDNLAMFERDGVELLAISCDHPGSLAAFAEQEGYTFSLLSDFWPHGEVSRAYGAFIEERGLATRKTVLIDRDGVIRAQFETSPGEARDLGSYRDALARL